MTLEELKRHTICVLGYGANHHGLVEFLLKHEMSLVIRERDKAKQDIFLKKYPDFKHLVSWELSDQILKQLDRFTLLFRSPGIPAQSPELQKVSQKGVLVYSQTKLFFDLCPAQIIGVTGTKGKGTTSTLIHRILKAGYEDGKVYLGGNIGVDPFTFYEKLEASDLVVLELSSFQLQDLKRSPQIAVLLTVDSDHLDHHKTVEEYKAAKEPLLRYQQSDDIAIINCIEPANTRYTKITPALTYLYSRRTPRRQSAWAITENGKEIIYVQVGSEIESFESTDRKLLGDHNLDNILPAVIVGRLLDVPIGIIAEEVRGFPGLEHRLSWVGVYNEVTFYEDSFATTPESGMVAIEAFKGKRLHVVAGGTDKGSDYIALASLIIERCATVSLLPGSATQKLQKALEKAVKKQPGCLILPNAREPLFPTILSGIQPHLKAGDVVLLSPASSSFASFNNYKERGELFAKAVHDRYSNIHA